MRIQWTHLLYLRSLFSPSNSRVTVMVIASRLMTDVISPPTHRRRPPHNKRPTDSPRATPERPLRVESHACRARGRERGRGVPVRGPRLLLLRRLLLLAVCCQPGSPKAGPKGVFSLTRVGQRARILFPPTGGDGTTRGFCLDAAFARRGNVRIVQCVGACLPPAIEACARSAAS